MKKNLLLLTAAMSLAFSGSALAMTKIEYNAENTKISANSKTAKNTCGALKNNAKDICMSEAKGVEKVAKAELETQYKPSARNTEKVAMAKGDSAYDTAKEKCDDLAGNAKDVCVKDARAVHVKAKEDAKVAKVATTTSNDKTEKVSEARKDANTEKREADYKVAKERCDSQNGVAKDGCLNTAKTTYGMK